MKICPVKISFLVLALYTYTVFAQNPSIDSLKRVLQTQIDDTNKVNTLNQLGRQLLDVDERNNYTAEQYAIQASVLSEKLNFLKGKAFALQTIGIRLELQDKYNEARKKYDSAILYYEKISDKYSIADVYSSIASSYRGEQNGPEALDYTYRSLKIFEEIGDLSGIAVTYLSLGSHSIEERDYKNAVKHLTYALDFFSKADSKETDAIAIINSSLGRVEYEQGNYKRALQFDSMALAGYSETGSVFNRGGVFLNMANIYEMMGDEASGLKAFPKAEYNYREAVKHYMFGVDVYKTTNADKFIFSTYNDIGRLYIKLHMLDSAGFYLSKSLDYHLKMDKDLKLIHTNSFEQLYLALSKLDSARGKLANAYENYKLYVAYKDNNSSEERAKRLQQIKLQYEFDKKEAIAKAEQGKKNAEAKRIRNLQYTVIGVILLIAIFLYWNSRQKQKAKAKIELAYSELKSAQQQLIQSEKMASLGELTAGIAHEIQNPLNFVNNFSEVNVELIKELEEAASSESREASNEADILLNIKENSEKINHHGKRADAIVKSMLQHSGGADGAKKKEPTDINTLADEYLRLAYHGFRAKNSNFTAELKIDLDPALPMVNVIPQDIGRVLLNLYNNAFWYSSVALAKEEFSSLISTKEDAVNEKFKSKGDFESPLDLTGYQPTVTLTTKNLGNTIEIRIRDNGPGIPKNIIDKIFQPFFTTKPTGQGTGLGLSMAYDIVKAHGGSISVISNYNEPGTIIVNTLNGPPGGDLKVLTKLGEGLPAEASAQAGSEFIIQLPA